MDDLKQRLMQASLCHVAFDGWSEAALLAGAADLGVSEAEARAAYPRGAIELAGAYHRAGDAKMLETLENTDLASMKIRERVTFAVRCRIELIEDKEAVRRGTALFALPQNAADGAGLIWGTADAIWTALGDTSEDVNWYTKRAILGGVYSSTILYWLGDDSPESEKTWAFLDRRIEDVMRIEAVKAQMRGNPVLSKMLAGPNWLLSQIKAPNRTARDDLPGTWNT